MQVTKLPRTDAESSEDTLAGNSASKEPKTRMRMFFTIPKLGNAPYGVERFSFDLGT